MTSVIGVHLAGKRVLVVGGGEVGTRRVRRLLAAGARVVVVAPEVSADIERLALHGDVAVERRPVVPGDLDGAWLVIAATSDSQVNDAVAAWADARTVWCVHASDALRGSARMSAETRHGEVVVGVVSLATADPGRIRGVRDAIGALLDAGEVSMRRTRSDAGGGKVILVGSGPGDPGLLTVRGRQALLEADVVVTDRLGATGALAVLDPGVEIINVGKSPDNHPVPQLEINRILVDRARKGRVVVRLKGGDSYVFGRGGEEVNACIAAGVPVEVVPGVTSAVAVAELAGIPVTHRGVADRVLIQTGHSGIDEGTTAAMRSGATLVLLMGVGALASIAADAMGAGIDPATPAAIIEQGSTSHQRVTRGTLGTIARIAQETGVKPPAIIVVGAVAREGFLASEEAATPESEETE